MLNSVIGRLNKCENELKDAPRTDDNQSSNYTQPDTVLARVDEMVTISKNSSQIQSSSLDGLLKDFEYTASSDNDPRAADHIFTTNKKHVTNPKSLSNSHLEMMNENETPDIDGNNSLVKRLLDDALVFSKTVNELKRLLRKSNRRYDKSLLDIQDAIISNNISMLKKYMGFHGGMIKSFVWPQSVVHHHHGVLGNKGVPCDEIESTLHQSTGYGAHQSRYTGELRDHDHNQHLVDPPDAKFDALTREITTKLVDDIMRRSLLKSVEGKSSNEHNSSTTIRVLETKAHTGKSCDTGQYSEIFVREDVCEKLEVSGKVVERSIRPEKLRGSELTRTFNNKKIITRDDTRKSGSFRPLNKVRNWNSAAIN